MGAMRDLSRVNMVPRPKTRIVMCFMASALFAASASIAQQTEKPKSSPKAQTELAVGISDEEIRSVQTRLIDAQLKEGLQNKAFSHAPIFGKSRDHEADVIRISLEVGKEYALIGVCGTGCRDMDLTLYDETGDFIAVDSAPEPTPRLVVTPGWTGEYVLEVAMIDCIASGKRDECVYAIGIFEEPPH